MMARALAVLIVGLWAAIGRPAEADELQFFHTPSGNIHCLAWSASDSTGVACDIMQVTKRTVRIPQPADCEFDWGNRFEVRVRGQAELVCYSDALISEDSRTLKYGTSLTFKGITCESRTDGLECRNRQGHGFFLSKARQALF